MSSRTISIIMVVCLLVAASGEAEVEEKDYGLRIYLPREIAIESDVPSLGQIGIIHGEESLVAKASKIVLGRISVPGQEVTIDRMVVLSRLACNGIPASKVRLTGAKEIKVRRQGQIIRGDEFAELARSFLGKSAFASSVCRAELARAVKDLIFEGTRKDIRLFPRLVKSSVPNQAKIQIAVLANGKEIGTRDVGFRLKYNSRRVVTLVDIPAGAVISPENVKIEKHVSDYPEPANWTLPYGLVARRRLAAKSVVRSSMVEPVKPPVVVKRNQNVVIRIDMYGLVITAMGKTMQDGRAGEYIRVRNVDSQRIILAKVSKDGTVEPVF